MPVLVRQEKSVQHGFDTAATLGVEPEAATIVVIDVLPDQEGRTEGTTYCGLAHLLALDVPFGSWYYSGALTSDVHAEDEASPEIGFTAPHSNSSDALTRTPTGLRAWEWDDLLRSAVEDSGTMLLRRLRKQISEYQRLPEDWDGYGGMPTTGKAAKVAEQILSETTGLAWKLRIEPSVGPLADGGLDIEWTSSVGHGLLVEVSPGGDSLNYVLSRKMAGGGFQDQNGRLEKEQVAVMIRQLV